MSNDHPHIQALRRRHQALEDQIAELEKRPSVDALEVGRLKRQKLQLKEELAGLS